MKNTKQTKQQSKQAEVKPCKLFTLTQAELDSIFDIDFDRVFDIDVDQVFGKASEKDETKH